MTSAAGRVGAGLGGRPRGPSDPAAGAHPRGRRGGRRGERGGPRGGRRRGDRERVRPGRSFPVHAGARGAGHRDRGRARGRPRDDPAAARSAGGDQGAHRDRPRQPELAAARAAGIPVEPWQQVVADAAVGRTLVAVAGTHGKSTTAGWLVHALVAAGADPSAFVGALLPSSLTGGPPATARLGDGPGVRGRSRRVRGQLRCLPPGRRGPHRGGVGSPRRVRRPRRGDRRVRGLAAAGCATAATLVVNVGDPGAELVVDRLRERRLHVIAYALADTSPRSRRVPARRPRAVRDGRRSGDGAAGPDRRGRPGRHDHRGLRARRARRRAHRASRHGRAGTTPPTRWRSPGRRRRSGSIPPRIAAGLAGFAGVGRRLERKGETGGVVVYDDYGHHPTAIRETLAAVRQREPGRRVWAVYEPLTYHRTAAMLDAFADVLAEADAVAIADIWAGRDPDTTITSAAALADAVAARRPTIPVFAPGDVEATAAALAEHVRAGDAVLVMGGGAVVPHRGAAAGSDWRRADDRLCGGGRSARAPMARHGPPSMATAGSRSSPRMPSTMRTRSASRSSGTTRFGRTCSTKPRPNATSTSRSNATGCRARRCSRRGTRRGSSGRTAGAFGWPGS